jgi:hypothetical protein
MLNQTRKCKQRKYYYYFSLKKNLEGLLFAKANRGKSISTSKEQAKNSKNGKSHKSHTASGKHILKV